MKPCSRYCRCRWAEKARTFSGRTNCLSRSEEHTSELQSQFHLVCRLLLEKKKLFLRHIEPRPRRRLADVSEGLLSMFCRELDEPHAMARASETSTATEVLRGTCMCDSQRV